MERLGQDLTFAFRLLLRRPGVTVVAVLTLALGIGANVAMVSFAGAILFPALPYDEPDRLVVLERWSERPGSEYRAISFPALVDWRERNRVCSHFAFFLQDHHNLTGDGGDPERLESQLVSANLLATLGIEPVLGRGFTPDEDRRGGERTVLLSYQLWQRRFGGDRAVLHHSVHLDDQEYAVIGVLPPGLSAERLGPYSRLGDIWLPAGLFHDDLAVDDRKIQYDMGVVCRLEPGLDTEAASADMARITHDLAQEYPSTDTNKKTEVVPVLEHLVGTHRPMILALVAAVGFVLLIACANLIHLFLTRFVARQQEFAVRLALGAGRRRLVLQAMTESLALALVGGMIGLILASFLVRALPAVVTDVPHTEQASISPLVMLYTIVLSLAVTLIVGLAPSVQTLSPSWHQLVTGALGSRSLPAHRRLRQALIVGEVALAIVLLAGTALSLATFLNLRDQDLGFSTDRVLSLEVALPASRYREDAEWTKFFDEALNQASTLPAVEAAAVMNVLPMSPDFPVAPAVAGDRPVPPRDKRGIASYFTVSSDFFRVLGIPVVDGRAFTTQDDDRQEAARVIVISEGLARTFWPDRTAVGQKVGFEFTGGTMDKPEVSWREVVGVVGDARLHDLRAAPSSAVYVPYTQRPIWVDGTSPAMVLVLKTAVEPTSLASAVRSEILKIDSDQPVHGISTFQEIVADKLQQAKTVLVLFTAFAGLALILAVVGIYGVVSYMVAARTRDLGIRIALGARPSQVIKGLVLRNLVLVLLGIGIGWILAAFLARLMASQLYGVDPLDSVVFLGCGSLIATVVLAATLVPAFQASRVDPVRSLHYE
jgi:putative ABC transport system permease protein